MDEVTERCRQALALAARSAEVGVFPIQGGRIETGNWAASTDPAATDPAATIPPRPSPRPQTQQQQHRS